MEKGTSENTNFHKKLTEYYLSCLSRSARPEVSLFAQSKWGPEYAELPTNPFLSPTLVENGNEISRVFSLRGKRDKDLYVGHLVFADFIQSSKSSWNGYILYPLLISTYDGDRNSIDATENPIFVNPEALKKLLGISSSTELQDSVLEFEEEIGLSGEEGNQISFDEVLGRIRDNFGYWPWVEPVPEALVSEDGKAIPFRPEKSLDQINTAGVYNRSLLFVADRQKFTLGLERELKDLSQLNSETFSESALFTWTENHEPISLGSTLSQQLPLLEPMPLNSEQRDAVNRALTEPLTVITGPPGTGKSQVVSSILINSAFRGESVLFSSKNNKAVDVVESRVNAIGKRPLLLRLGARDLQHRLSDYLTRISSKDSSPDDLLEFKNLTEQYGRLGNSVNILHAEISQLIEKRNNLDDLDLLMETIRSELGTSSISHLENETRQNIIHQISNFQTSYNRLYNHKKFLKKFFPNLNKQKNETSLKESISELNKVLGITSDLRNLDLHEKAKIDKRKNELQELLTALSQLDKYKDLLKELSYSPDMGEISAEFSSLQNETSKQSVRLWQSWLKTLPDRLDPDSRKILGTFKTTVELLARANDGRSAATLKKEQQQMFASVLKFLPAWAVTSLSVRGRVPFSPGMFDLVVIDEASQCDIASALPLLFRARRAVIIGDPLQLRHVASIDGTTDRILLDQFELMKNLEWSYSAQSLFDLASSIRPENATIVLRDHHRSDSEIIGFSNSAFYDGQLRVATRHDALKRPTNMETAIRWVETAGTGFRPSNGSVLCREEAIAVVNELDRLSKQGYEGTVGVVTPFAPQSRYISDLINQRDDLKPFLARSDFNVSTAHGFQGDERDVIIMSLALQPGTPESAIKFVSNQSNLFNVAVTRAKAALVIVGDSKTKEVSKVPFVADFVAYIDGLQNKKIIKNADVDTDFGPLFPLERKDNSVSDYEIIFYEALYKQGVKTIPQWNEDQYRLDLAMFKGNKKLDIEVDGERYHRQWNGESVRRDLLRNQRLIELGWDVQRFWVYQIIEDLDGCVARVQKWASSN
jgi:very-short-patch-repair endonuclease